MFRRIRTFWSASMAERAGSFAADTGDRMAMYSVPERFHAAWRKGYQDRLTSLSANPMLPAVSFNSELFRE